MQESCLDVQSAHLHYQRIIASVQQYLDNWSACKRISPTNIGGLCIKLIHRDNTIGQWFVYPLIVVRLDNACAHAP